MQVAMILLDFDPEIPEHNRCQVKYYQQDEKWPHKEQPPHPQSWTLQPARAEVTFPRTLQPGPKARCLTRLFSTSKPAENKFIRTDNRTGLYIFISVSTLKRRTYVVFFGKRFQSTTYWNRLYDSKECLCFCSCRGSRNNFCFLSCWDVFYQQLEKLRVFKAKYWNFIIWHQEEEKTKKNQKKQNPQLNKLETLAMKRQRAEGD